MARATKRICSNCQKAVPAEETIKVGTKYYCEPCGKKQRTEAEAYKELVAYICQLYGLAAPTMLILSQIKRYKEEDYTYQGMKASLQYFFELQGHDVRESGGIGIIPYVYEETKDFYAQGSARKKKIRSLEWDSENNVNVVTVQREEEKPSQPNLMDINLIGGDEDE